jgi:hypothetical protein
VKYGIDKIYRKEIKIIKNCNREYIFYTAKWQIEECFYAMLAIISLLVVLTVSILITRIATVALTRIGLSREAACFQARSAFTGVGCEGKGC